MSIGWEISGSPVFASVIPFFFLLFQAESAVLRKLFRLDRVVCRLPCQDEQRHGEKGAHSLLPLLVMPSKAIVGIVRRGKVAQVSHSGGMLDFHLRKDLLGRSDILTSQADSQS